MNDINDIWQKTLDNIKNVIDSLSFDTWFKNIDVIDIKDNKLRIVIPMMLYKNHIDYNYKNIIITNFNRLSNVPVDDITYILKDNLGDILNEKQLINNNVEKEKVNNDIDYKSNLNPNYTFENFVVGESNKFAQAAALAVAENPGKMYNPLFIYGNSGLGKTHLMHAIGNYIISKSNKRVLYVTCDQFVEDFIGLSRKNNKNGNLDYMEFFKNKYRNIDVLIIDDIQFLSGASASQQEFFHTFNNLYNDS